MTRPVATTNTCMDSEEANFALALEQLPQFESMGQSLLDQMTTTIKVLQTTQLTPEQQQPLSSLQAHASQLEGVLTQLPKVAQQLNQAHELLAAKLTERTQQLQTTQAQLLQSEKMASLGNLVSGVAHEVNNPVGFITGNIKPALAYIEDLFDLIELYEEQYATPNEVIEEKAEDIDLDYIREDLPKLVGSIQSGAKRIASISHSLRTFSRADTDTPVAFNIHNGLNSTLLILKHRLKANDDRPAIEIRTDYDEALPAVECYAGQLNQVFMNLLANAIDALEEGEISKENPAYIELKTRLLETPNNLQPDNPQVEITIRDNGVGMSPDVQQKVFDHLFTTKPVGQGTGLGLAIAHQIIKEKHQGHIALQSVAGEGTAFIVTLPVKAKHSRASDIAS